MLDRASSRDLAELQEAFRIESQERLLEKWERFSVREPDVEAYLGHPVAEMTGEEYQQLEEVLARAEKTAARSTHPIKWILRRKDPP